MPISVAVPRSSTTIVPTSHTPEIIGDQTVDLDRLRTPENLPEPACGHPFAGQHPRALAADVHDGYHANTVPSAAVPTVAEEVVVGDQLADIRRTLHIHSDDVPFVTRAPGWEFRLLHARLDEPLVVSELRAQPGVQSGLHRHLTPVYGWTVEGTWGHDDQFLYRPGTYIYETPGVPHRFMNGPAVTRAVYIRTSGVEQIDPETGAVTSVSVLSDQIDQYFALCEEAGLPRPDVLE